MATNTQRDEKLDSRASALAPAMTTDALFSSVQFAPEVKPGKLTFAIVKTQLDLIGWQIRRIAETREYRIYPKFQPTLDYFTDDLGDALGTALLESKRSKGVS